MTYIPNLGNGFLPSKERYLRHPIYLPRHPGTQAVREGGLATDEGVDGWEGGGPGRVQE